MAKDPAFLFYPGDWQGGTMTFSRFLKGCYIDVLIAQFNNGHLSLDEIKTVLGSDFGQAWPTLQKKFVQDENGLWFNEKLEHETKRRREYTESRRQSRLKSDEDNVRIYLIKDNDSGYTKIGSSVNPQRRFAEMINQASPAIVPGTGRNYTLTWFSEPTQRKIEKTIHQHFKSQRVKGEWFDLTEDEIRTLIHTFFRTSLRTGNGNEDGNDLKIKNELHKKDSRETLDERISSALDELYIDQQRMKWSHIDFDLELFGFVEKVRGSPEHYANHDTAGIRLAFQAQLRSAKRKPNGKSYNKNDRTEFNQNELAIIAAHASGGGGTEKP